MADLQCGVSAPSGTLSGSLSACEPPICAILDTNIKPAWDMYDTSECNPEHAFFDSTLVEYNDISGFAVEVRVLLHNDERLFGEDPNASLSDPILTKVTFEPTEESSILSTWGISFDDTMQYMMIPKATWKRDATATYTSTDELSAMAIVPKAGDVVTVLFNGKNYEITDVGSTGTIFNSKKFVYEFILRPYRFSEQSDEHRMVEMGLYDDPFATMTTNPTGGMVEQNNYGTDQFGDNEFIEDESDKIDDYRDITDPDKGAFGY